MRKGVDTEGRVQRGDLEREARESERERRRAGAREAGYRIREGKILRCRHAR